MKGPRVPVATAATLAAAALWGTSFIANDYGLLGADASTFAALRFAVAAASCWVVLAVVEPAAVRAAPWRSHLPWTLGGLTAAAFLLQYLGQEITTPARTALFVNANVFTVALLQLVVQRSRPPAGMIAFAAVAVAGVAVLTLSSRDATLEGGSLLGDALAFGGGAAWAFYAIGAKRAVGSSSALALTTWTFTGAAIVLAPIAVVGGDGIPTGAVAWAAILYTGLLCSTLAYVLWSWGLRGLSPTASAVVLLVEVPVATALSVALGLDRVTAATAAGAALLFAGVAGASVIEARSEAKREGPGAAT
ncbi:MAG TPA: DMT family transporter [Candidatus Thermoplasmatota archaeon]|nr:DMT family transporter [Candidatus Thermoplasmatota archaeon]